MEDLLRAAYLGTTFDGDLLADEIVVESPYAPPGRGKRFEGTREEFLARVAAERAALPFRLDDVRIEAVHETADPEVRIAEFDLSGAITATGERRTARFVVVLRIRDGKVVQWREYQDTLALMQAMTGS